MLSLKVACLGPIDYIDCPKTKEITLYNKIQHYCRKLKSEFFKNKIRSKDSKLMEIIEKKRTLHLFWPIAVINKDSYIVSNSFFIVTYFM